MDMGTRYNSLIIFLLYLINHPVYKFGDLHLLKFPSNTVLLQSVSRFIRKVICHFG